MRETIYKCDICGNECDPDQMLHTEDGKDVCVKCLEKLVRQHFKNEVVKKVAKVTKVADKEPQKIDVGKAQALRDAGWTVEKVAKELGCCVATVYAYTHSPEKKKNKKPFEWNDDDMKRLGIEVEDDTGTY